MKRTLKLTNVYFKELFFGLFGGKNKKGASKMLPLYVLLFFAIGGAIGFSLYNMGKSLKILNMQQNILFMGLLMGSFMSLMITLNDNQGIMYGAKDYDMLASLPLKNTHIIFAKFMSTYLISAVYFSVILIPTFIVYFIFMGISVSAVIFGLLSLLFMPAFSQFISCILGWLVNIISSKMTNKNIIKTIISLIMSVGIAVFFALANNNLLDSLFIDGFPLWFKIVFSNIYFLFTSVVESNILFVLYFVLTSIGFVLLSILLISLGYKKINSSLMTTKVKRKQKPIEYTEKSVFSRLLSKEFSTLLNHPTYCINTLMGVIMCVVMTILCLAIPTGFEELESIPGAKETISVIFNTMIIFMITMCMGIAPASAVNTSMEGTKLQTLKSLPISFKNIAFSKCGINIILYVPVVLICFIVYSIVAKLGVLLSALAITYLLVSLFTQTMFGFLLNIKFPRLNWTSETQAAKNGASLLITMVVDMVTTIIPMGIFFSVYFTTAWLTLELFMAICLVLQVIFAIITLVILIKKGKKIYEEIQV